MRGEGNFFCLFFSASLCSVERVTVLFGRATVLFSYERFLDIHVNLWYPEMS